jgi:hypothetical protein
MGFTAFMRVYDTLLDLMVFGIRTSVLSVSFNPTYGTWFFSVGKFVAGYLVIGRILI